MRKSRKEQLEKALDYIPEGQGIDLENDVFLTGKELDGSDKVYGFKKEDGELLVVTREASEGFRISDMDKEDMTYIFNLSAPNIFKKIVGKKYPLVNGDDL